MKFSLITSGWSLIRRMGPSSFQWCPVTAQGAMGTNWSTGSSVWIWRRISSLWGWRSTGTGCPGRLWSLLLWRYSRPTWTTSSTTYCRWPCFGRSVGLDDPQRSLPSPTILWFCDSVITWPYHCGCEFMIFFLDIFFIWFIKFNDHFHRTFFWSLYTHKYSAYISKEICELH